MTGFAFSAASQEKIAQLLACYPQECAASAVLPVLDLAQRDNQGWLSPEAIAAVAKLLQMPKMRVQEVVSFYSLFTTQPPGRFLVQVCRTTPCWLRGSDDISQACLSAAGCQALGETSGDGHFTVVEVECLGACCNAPMMQINDDYFEDLTPKIAEDILACLRRGEKVTVGSQIGRLGSAPSPAAAQAPSPAADRASSPTAARAPSPAAAQAPSPAAAQASQTQSQDAAPQSGRST